MRHYKCSECRKYSLVLMRWRLLTPIGVCTSCHAIKELTFKEIGRMIRRICDYCGDVIPDGTGGKYNGKLTRPITAPDGEDVAIETTVDESPELCDGCAEAYERLYEPEKIRATIRGIKAAISRAKKKEAEEEGTPTPPSTTV